MIYLLSISTARVYSFPVVSVVFYIRAPLPVRSHTVYQGVLSHLLSHYAYFLREHAQNSAAGNVCELQRENLKTL